MVVAGPKRRKEQENFHRLTLAKQQRLFNPYTLAKQQSQLRLFNASGVSPCPLSLRDLGRPERSLELRDAVRSTARIGPGPGVPVV